jgi:intracellular septation protein A
MYYLVATVIHVQSVRSQIYIYIYVCVCIYIYIYMYTASDLELNTEVLTLTPLTLCIYIYIYIYTHSVSQDLRSILRDLIPELMLSQTRHNTWVQFATFQKI